MEATKEIKEEKAHNEKNEEEEWKEVWGGARKRIKDIGKAIKEKRDYKRKRKRIERSANKK